MILCPECDLAVERVALEEGRQAHCPRCRALLYRHHPYAYSTLLALSVTGALLVVPATTLPLISLDVYGQSQQASLFDSLGLLFQTGRTLMAIILFVCGFLAPLLFFGFLSDLLFCAWRQRLTDRHRVMLKWIDFFQRWSMPEVAVLGVCVAAFKLDQLGLLRLETGLWVLVAVMLLLIKVSIRLEKEALWRELELSRARG